jgi:hypothetical protein
VEVHTTARGERYRGRECEVVLRKCAGGHEVVLELRGVARRVAVTLNGEATDPGLPAGGAANGNLSERCVVAVTLEHVSELMIVTLSRDSGAGRNDVALLQQELTKGSDVVSTRLKSFDVRRTGRRQQRSAGCAAIAVFVRESGSGEERTAVASIPEQTRTDDRTAIPGQVCPRIVVHVGDFLPVTTTEQRGTPTA